MLNVYDFAATCKSWVVLWDRQSKEPQSIKPRNREHFFTQNAHIWLREKAPLKSEIPAENSSKLQVQIQSPICAVQKCKTWEELISEE